MTPLEEPAKTIGDATGLGLVVAAWTDYLPTIAALLSVIWFALRIMESLQTIYYKRLEQKKVEKLITTVKATVETIHDEDRPKGIL